MSDFVFELDRAGVRELLQSSEMAEAVREFSDQVLANAGGSSAGYDMNVQTDNRAVGRVFCSDKKGYRDNTENNTLLKALRCKDD